MKIGTCVTMDTKVSLSSVQFVSFSLPVCLRCIMWTRLGIV